MNLLQENLLQLLVELDEICKKHDIEYYFIGGTLLGAIRHHRFLPWDDDVDICMTRKNWNKLRAVVENEKDVIPEGRALVYNENTEYYRNCIPRYVSNESTSLIKSQVVAGKACGQLIDFFLMNPMPVGEKEVQEYLDLFRVYAEILSSYFIACVNLTMDEWDRHIEIYEKYQKKIEQEGEEKVLKDLEDWLTGFPEEDCEYYYTNWANRTDIYEKDHFKENIHIEFEGKMFPVLNNPEHYLRVRYGDTWMYVPEYENQIVHNTIKNVNVPIKEYTDRYLEKINREDVYKKFADNSRNNVRLFGKRRKINLLNAKAKIALKSGEINNNLNKKTDYLNSLLNDKDYSTLLNEFEDYLELQLLHDVKKYHSLVPISDKHLEILLLCLIGKGEYFNANTILNIYKDNKELSNNLIEIEKEIEFCRQLSIARYDEKDDIKLKELMDEFGSKYPELIDIYRAKLWIMDKNAKNLEDYKAIDELSKKTLELYPFDGESMAFQAKAQLEIGNEKEAMELYEKAIENTRNGIIWQKVEDESGISRIDIECDLIEALKNGN